MRGRAGARGLTAGFDRQDRVVLKPGGTLILECTNGRHLLDRVNQLRNHLAWLFHPPKYKMNILSATAIRKMAQNHEFKLAGEFRYGLPLPGTRRFYSADGACTTTRSLFGDIDHNRNLQVQDKIE